MEEYICSNCTAFFMGIGRDSIKGLLANCLNDHLANFVSKAFLGSANRDRLLSMAKDKIIPKKEPVQSLRDILKAKVLARKEV